MLTTVIVSDKDISIRFEGESFWEPSKVPRFDGDQVDGSFSRTCESVITFDESANALLTPRARSPHGQLVGAHGLGV